MSGTRMTLIRRRNRTNPPRSGGSLIGNEGLKRGAGAADSNIGLGSSSIGRLGRLYARWERGFLARRRLWQIPPASTAGGTPALPGLLHAQVLLDELPHRGAKMRVQRRIDHAVPRLRIELELIRLVRFFQFVDELNRVLHVHVVVDRAVHQ